ncbi:uncharacterized protein N7511_001388 [Penicillium nucicola]|uniref:uncharacterized protein n=1 Tax=Penicillium nucicola TaxID=1850975 RepID=UPI002545963E|nr:uncharacterized protein N7511_001388 [Penicillium nucicola]KAJ5776377.1 hypothetical protein N7511_001388 [Penicillium nucicola]
MPPDNPSPQVHSQPALIKRAKRFRILSTLLSLLDRYLSTPLPPKPSTIITIPTTLNKTPGQIDLYIYTSPSNPLTKTKTPNPPRPVLLNLHGGGFTIGHAQDDARWCTAILTPQPAAIAISINYRLAPEHPFPTALDDTVDAILWLWNHADEYNLDQSRFVLSGASAGGNLVLGVPFRVEDVLKGRTVEARAGECGVRFAGIVAFYPPVDWTKSRERRDESNPIAKKKSMISPAVFALFDDSYLGCGDLPRRFPPVLNASTSVSASTSTSISEAGARVGEVDMAHPYLSPGLASDELIRSVYPPNVAIYTCSWDQLLVEGETFRDRLRGFVRTGWMRSVGGYQVEGVVHGFDKRPSFWRGDEAREKMYGDALREVEEMWNAA